MAADATGGPIYLQQQPRRAAQEAELAEKKAS
jgi:hypothetical protein